MNLKQMRWLMWTWRVVGATYVAGFLTLFTSGALIVFWTALLFTPLLVVTLAATRSRLLAWVGIPVIGAALFAAVHLILVLAPNGQTEFSFLFNVVWLTASLGPFVLYPIVTRHLSNRIKATPDQPQST
jgi:hypothetical protein